MGEPTSLPNFSFPIPDKATERNTPALRYALGQTRRRLNSPPPYLPL
jgi:hypothetical protein